MITIDRTRVKRVKLLREIEISEFRRHYMSTRVTCNNRTIYIGRRVLIEFVVIVNVYKFGLDVYYLQNNINQ